LEICFHCNLALLKTFIFDFHVSKKYRGERMFKHNIAILIVLTILLMTFSVSSTRTASEGITLPYKMDYKTFQLEVLQGQSAIVYYQGMMYLNLTLTTELPMGTVYDPVRKVVYMAIYPTYSNPDLVWGIAEINITDYSYKIYRFPWYIDGIFYGPRPWTIAEDGNGELWVSISGYLNYPNHPPSNIPYLAKLNTYNTTLYIYYIPVELSGGCDIKSHNDYIWYLTNSGLSKINYTTEEIVESYFRDFSGGFMQPDGDSLWLSSVSGDFITRFNTTARYFDVNLTGFDRPLGIYADSQCLYVAENSRNAGAVGTIVQINKTSLEITRITTTTITNEGPFYVLKDSAGNLWWTDNSKHFGVISTYGVKINYESISPYNYFISELPGNSVLFSCKGSALAGIMSSPKSPDVNNDGIVNMRDITAIILDFNAAQGDGRYKPECDLDNNEIVNMRDVTIAILCFNKRTS
jgi:hypothetical protein